MQPYIGNTMPTDVLAKIIRETIDFDFPLVNITDNIATLELFHGPTLAFKDVGARFMSRCLGYFCRNNTKKVTVLVATSGDTGGAVADGFFGVDNVEVVILYPSGKVSPIQELQLTTLGGNIHALEVEGTFDDCQRMVKDAFMDADLQQRLFLTSANSINVARWLPQQLYYFFALQQWQDMDAPPVVCVPSCSFGNICSGILASVSGLPVQHFIAACNANDVVPRFLQTNKYEPTPAQATISNAMDVGNPSNFVRVMEIFQQQFEQVRNALSSVSITDEATKQTIKRVFEQYDYVLDPHGAVGFLALEQHLLKHPSQKGFFLETAHPVKFPQSVEEITQQAIPIPASVQSILYKTKVATKVAASADILKDFLLENC
jgi:threonine synthase